MEKPKVNLSGPVSKSVQESIDKKRVQIARKKLAAKIILKKITDEEKELDKDQESVWTANNAKYAQLLEEDEVVS